MAIVTRRSFLTGLGAAVGIVAAEPIRRYWAVGADLSRSPKTFVGVDLGFDGDHVVVQDLHRYGYTATDGTFIPQTDVRSTDRDILSGKDLLLTHDGRAYEISGQSMTYDPASVRVVINGVEHKASDFALAAT